MSGRLFIISAPSGAGKTTIVKRVCKELPSLILGISCTTRPPRSSEIEGADYYFLTEQAFEEMVLKEAFLEHTRHFGYSYGTLKKEVHSRMEEGKSIILVIDTEGALFIKKQIPSAVLIFIDVPSMEELELRLHQRSTEDPLLIQKRLSKAKDELAVQHHYDYRIVNENINDAVEKLKSIIIAENNKI